MGLAHLGLGHGLEILIPCSLVPRLRCHSSPPRLNPHFIFSQLATTSNIIHSKNRILPERACATEQPHHESAVITNVFRKNHFFKSTNFLPKTETSAQHSTPGTKSFRTNSVLSPPLLLSEGSFLSLLLKPVVFLPSLASWDNCSALIPSLFPRDSSSWHIVHPAPATSYSYRQLGWIFLLAAFNVTSI